MAIFQDFKNVLFILCFWVWYTECCVNLCKNSYAKILAYRWIPGVLDPTIRNSNSRGTVGGVQESAYVINTQIILLLTQLFI